MKIIIENDRGNEIASFNIDGNNIEPINNCSVADIDCDTRIQLNENIARMDDFLRQYIQDLIDGYDDEFDIKEEDIEDIICHTENNDYVWDMLDETILNELEQYRKEEQ